MSRTASYDLLVDGELIEVQLAVWSVRLDRIDQWVNQAYRTSTLYDKLLEVYKAANRAHTDLTTLHVYQKRNPVTSSKIQRQLQVATESHQKANLLYPQLLDDMSD